VTYASSGGALVDSANLTFNSQNLTLINTAAATPLNGKWALNVDGNANMAATFSADAEAYVINTQSAKNQYYQAGTLVSLSSSSSPTTVNSAALIDFNAYNSSDGATNIFLGAIAGPSGNGAANFVLGRRTNTTSWAESLRVDTAGALVTTPDAGSTTVFNENGVDADFRVESDGYSNMLYVDGGTNTVGIGTSVTDVSSLGLIVNSNTTADEASISIVRNAFKSSPVNIGAMYWFNGGDATERAKPLAGIWGKDEYSGSTYNGSLQLGSQTSNTLHTRISLQPSETVVNEDSNDFDFRVESNDNAYMLFVDAGNNRVGVGTNTPGKVFFTTSAPDTSTSTNGAQFGITNPGLTTAQINSISTGIGSSGIASNHGGDQHIRSFWGTTIETGAGGVTGGATNSVVAENAFSVRQYSTSTSSFNNNLVMYTLGGATVFNEDGIDRDFRVESDTNTHMLFVDGGSNAVGIGTSAINDAWGSSFVPLYVGSGGLRLGSTGASSTFSNMLHSGYYNGTNWIQSFTDVTVARIEFVGSAAGSNQNFYTANNVTAGTAITSIRNLALSPSATVFNEDSLDLDFRVESDANTHMLFVDAGNNGVNIGDNSAVPPLSGLRVVGAINPDGGIVATEHIAGYVASNYTGTRYWVLHDMTGNPATAFNCQGDLIAASYSVWNNSRIFIRRTYNTFTVVGSITGIAASGVTVSIVDISYSSSRYIALKFAGGDPAIEANLIGYLLKEMYTNGTDAFFINGTGGVTENSVIASYP
jgi:hypothetical protein